MYFYGLKSEEMTYLAGHLGWGGGAIGTELFKFRKHVLCMSHLEGSMKVNNGSQRRRNLH